jgi:PIN domain nuclease of toxin-antitoxin system
VKVLLDTHCFLWWISEKEKLNREATRIIARGENTVYFSAASAWEIAIKTSIGKLGLPPPPRSFVPAQVAEQGMTPLPIDQVHALHAGTLPLLHKDPFDRLLVAQARIEDLPILTADRKLLPYGVKVIWAGTEPRPAASPSARRPRRGGRGAPPRR